jgi:hypothetical protein
LNDAEDYPSLSSVDPRFLNPYYEQSGWPMVLAPIANEAWRRYDAGELACDEFYCSGAAKAGAAFRGGRVGRRTLLPWMLPADSSGHSPFMLEIRW